MAHFAQIDENNIVIQVVVISNDDLLDENGIEQESQGVDVCRSIFGEQTNWVQTSFNKKFRKHFAGIGCKYDPINDAFYSPYPPYQSWLLDDDFVWQPPTPVPDDGKPYTWDEDSLTWVEVPVEEPEP